MIQLVKSAFILIGIGVLASACSVVDSDNVKTGGFYTTFSISQQAAQKPVASAIFQVGGPTGTSINLTSNDEIACNDVELARTQAPIINLITYNAALDQKASYKFEFSRTGEPTYERSIAHPEAFQITNQAPIALKYDGSVAINWQNSATAGKVSITVDAGGGAAGCQGVTVIKSGLPDTGSYTFNGNELLLRDGTKPACTYTVTVGRTVSNDVGAPFQGGYLLARHTETIQLNVGP